jgi:hypothetical protein
MSDSNAGAGDTYTETTHVSWMQRLKNAIAGVVGGFVLVIAACGALFWNEGRAVQTARSLAEGGRVVIAVDAARVDPSNEGKLVHVSGPVTTGEPLLDAEFGVSARGLRLVRTVEMYQWRENRRTETRKNLGGSEETVTVYSYVREWSTSRNDSSRFNQRMGHENPEMRFGARDIFSADAALGAFRPGDDVLRLISARDAVPLDPAVANPVRQRMGSAAQVVDNRIYLGANPNSPRVGDHRISYTVANPEALSIVGRQAGNGFARYQTMAGDQLLMATVGIVPAQDMFKAAERENTIITWLVRLAGIVFVFVGFNLVLRPFVVVGDFVPLIGSMLSAGAGLVSLLLTAVLAPTVIAIAWFWYRPLVSIAVLAAGGVAAVAVKMLAARRAAERERLQPAQ